MFALSGGNRYLAGHNKPHIMEREKVHLEFLLNGTSRAVLWTSISTPSGLERWFADRVSAEGKTWTFQWGKTERRRADVIGMRANTYIRFRWQDVDQPREYFEIRMSKSDLTNDYVLEVIDFAPEDEVDDLIGLWESQVDSLRRNCGC